MPGAVPIESEGGWVRSVNVGALVPNPAKGGLTGMGKRPAQGPVWVRAPGAAKGRSGLDGDGIGDSKNHGGDDQAVYAFAREDLDAWEVLLGRALPDGSFGENLTTVGIDPNECPIGERWRVGPQLLLQVTCPRIPCKTFAYWLSETGWIRRFTAAGRPGAYLKVLEPGPVKAADPITVVHRPSHDVSISMALFALTTKPELLGGLLGAGADLPEEMRENIEGKGK